jgi:pimeloyl-ACP methyl ester carboxylesterase
MVGPLAVPCWRSGAPGGFPVLYFHGLPSHPYESALAAPAARALGIELLAIERPGYASMRPLPDLGLGGYARLVGRVARTLGIHRCAVLGVSGGAASALACAALLPGLVTAAAIICGLGPADDGPARSAMPAHLRRSLALARHLPSFRRILLGLLGPGLFRRRPSLPFAWLNLHGMPADRRILADPVVRRVLVTASRAAFGPGAAGPDRDLTLAGRSWDLPLAAIRVPVRLHHGDDDRTVAPVCSAGLARRIPGARYLPYAGEGHFSLPVRHARTILADLLAAAEGAA